jgi:hypothetical protein
LQNQSPTLSAVGLFCLSPEAGEIVVAVDKNGDDVDSAALISLFFGDGIVLS